ncbi:hypothetical protein D3C84_751690 [compost metagenome]
MLDEPMGPLISLLIQLPVSTTDSVFNKRNSLRIRIRLQLKLLVQGLMFRIEGGCLVVGV